MPVVRPYIDEETPTVELPLYRCAGANCPGYPWRASDLAHPASCVAEPPAAPAGEARS